MLKLTENWKSYILNYHFYPLIHYTCLTGKSERFTPDSVVELVELLLKNYRMLEYKTITIEFRRQGDEKLPSPFPDDGEERVLRVMVNLSDMFEV